MVGPKNIRFWFTFQQIYVPTIFSTSGKNCPKSKWTIYKHESYQESYKSKKCQSVGNLGILSVV